MLINSNREKGVEVPNVLLVVNVSNSVELEMEISEPLPAVLVVHPMVWEHNLVVGKEELNSAELNLVDNNLAGRNLAEDNMAEHNMAEHNLAGHLMVGHNLAEHLMVEVMVEMLDRMVGSNNSVKFNHMETNCKVSATSTTD